MRTLYASESAKVVAPRRAVPTSRLVDNPIFGPSTPSFMGNNVRNTGCSTFLLFRCLEGKLTSGYSRALRSVANFKEQRFIV